jgi:hypothetical protein
LQEHEGYHKQQQQSRPPLRTGEPLQLQVHRWQGDMQTQAQTQNETHLLAGIEAEKSSGGSAHVRGSCCDYGEPCRSHTNTHGHTQSHKQISQPQYHQAYQHQMASQYQPLPNYTQQNLHHNKYTIHHDSVSGAGQGSGNSLANVSHPVISRTCNDQNRRRIVQQQHHQNQFRQQHPTPQRPQRSLGNDNNTHNMNNLSNLHNMAGMHHVANSMGGMNNTMNDMAMPNVNGITSMGDMGSINGAYSLNDMNNVNGMNNIPDAGNMNNVGGVVNNLNETGYGQETSTQYQQHRDPHHFQQPQMQNHQQQHERKQNHQQKHEHKQNEQQGYQQHRLMQHQSHCQQPFQQTTQQHVEFTFPDTIGNESMLAPLLNVTNPPLPNVTNDKGDGSSSPPVVGGIRASEYSCDICGETFRQKRARDAHQRQNHERAHSCALCPSRFKTRSDANRHNRVVHLRYVSTAICDNLPAISESTSLTLRLCCHYPGCVS